MSENVWVEQDFEGTAPIGRMSQAQQAALVGDVLGFLPAIPLMLKQLGGAMRHVEDAVLRVSSRLGDIVDMVRDANSDEPYETPESADAAEQLTQDLSKTVVALQFQDAVDQRVNGIMAILREFHELVTARLDGSHIGPPRTTSEWIRRMESRYVTQAERVTFREHVLSTGSGAEWVNCDVELFDN